MTGKKEGIRKKGSSLCGFEQVITPSRPKNSETAEPVKSTNSTPSANLSDVHGEFPQRDLHNR
jgi:hypothetical protein